MSGCPDISASDTASFGLRSAVASCSCHHLHWGSWCVCLLESCPLSGSLRQTKACFCLTNYLASLFTVLWSNKVAFHSVICGYPYFKQIIIFHSKFWWSDCSGMVCINTKNSLFTCMCAWMISVDKRLIITTCSVAASMQKEACASSRRSSRCHIQRCLTTTHVWVDAIPIL